MKEEFLRELAELLNKYQADISVGMDDCLDTYGISGEKLIISVMDIDVLKVPGWSLNGSDIERGARAC